MKFNYPTRIIQIILICALPLNAGSIKNEYQVRVQQVLNWADSVQSKNFFVAAVRIKKGQHVQEGLNIFEERLKHLEKSPSGMFDIYSLMISYLAVENQIPAYLKKQVRQTMAAANFYRGDTENHLTMYYTGLYLAAQTFPDLPAKKWYTGKSSAANMEEALGWLNAWMQTTTTIGQGEFDSPTYTPVFLAPMFGLYQWATDPALKKNAEAMLYWLIADFAAEHLNGMYVGAHSREYPERLIDKTCSDMTGWSWLLFGQISPKYNGTLIPAALSDFVIPDILYQVGTDRNKPYVHTETKRVRNIIRLGEEKNPPVYKYTYMTKDFALGSMMGGSVLQPIQQHTWDVSFVSPSTAASIFTVHPFTDEKDLGMFFPEEMKFTVKEVSNFHRYYGDEGKWSSSSPYEQTFQHENAIIVLYDIPKGTRFEHIDGFFPKDLDERITDSSGWIFCRSGRTYIAFFPLQPAEWIEEETGFRLRSCALKNGCVVEVAQAENYTSFNAFQKQICSNTLARDTFNETLTVSYTTSSGEVMTFTYNGPRRLNGQAINFADYKLFRGPFLNAEPGSRKLDIRCRNKGLMVDLATQEKALILPQFICQKIARNLELSGKMDDPLWEKAVKLPLVDAISGERGRFTTQVRALYNEKYLYVGFECEDDYVWGTHSAHDAPIWENECVEVFLNPAGCAHQHYEINLSPKNVVFDACIINARTPEKPYEKFSGFSALNLNELQTRTYIKGTADLPGKAQNWTAEYAIPVAELFGAPNIPPKAGDTWRVNFYRIDSPKKGQRNHYAWSYTERAAFHLPWRFGYLIFGE